MEQQLEKEIREIRVDGYQKNRKIFKKYLLIFFVIFLIGQSYFWGYSQGRKGFLENKKIPFIGSIIKNSQPSGDEQVDFSLFWKVWDLVKDKYINKTSLDAQEMLYGAIKGMVRATGDPYTNFLDPQETEDLNVQIDGKFEGIGAELGIKDGILTVIAPLEDSPAAKAGLLAGDKILKIDDKITADMSIDESVDLIRGKKGTEVKMTIVRPEEEDVREYSIIRDTILITSVKLEMKDNNLAYIKINEFGEDTTKEFDKAAQAVLSGGARGIILDLRNNPGGLLDKSTEIASYFIPKGKVVVTEEDSSGKKQNLFTRGGDKLGSLPLVVLINEGSASASEILAGALKENLGTTLVGRKTFGKGSVQQVIPLPNKSSVKITIAKWLTPNGNYIMEKGIEPDENVEVTAKDIEEKKDPQLEKATAVIMEKLK